MLIWEAEYDEECVTSYGEQGKLKGVSVLTGNHSDPKMARKWIRKSGGKFDVIVYDGSHKNSHIMNTFLALWPALNPGGNYFIEDMEVGFNPINQEDGYPPITKVMQAWVEHLQLQNLHTKVLDHHQQILNKFPLPNDLDLISCQKHACVLHKEE
eukprot:gene23879-27020_t